VRAGTAEYLIAVGRTAPKSSARFVRGCNDSNIVIRGARGLVPMRAIGLGCNKLE
jgi:hypothetical protein